MWLGAGENDVVQISRWQNRLLSALVHRSASDVYEVSHHSRPLCDPGHVTSYLVAIVTDSVTLVTWQYHTFCMKLTHIFVLQSLLVDSVANCSVPYRKYSTCPHWHIQYQSLRNQSVSVHMFVCLSVCLSVRVDGICWSWLVLRSSQMRLLSGTPASPLCCQRWVVACDYHLIMEWLSCHSCHHWMTVKSLSHIELNDKGCFEQFTQHRCHTINQDVSTRGSTLTYDAAMSLYNITYWTVVHLL